MNYGERAGQALAWAFALHATQRRKQSEVPYVTHLLAVAALVGEHGGDEDQFIAALLHDAVEDQGGPAVAAEIAARFGDRVAGLVAACTDTDEEPKPPWRARKEAHVAHVAHAPLEARLILAADKLHNARATTRDLRRHGPGVFERFRGGREGTLWYYGAMHAALGAGWAHPILDELAEAVAALHAAAKG
jgi:(p)ppGpp synthase/HD superfamily hydrolase